jgi:hypothetical protein
MIEKDTHGITLLLFEHLSHYDDLFHGISTRCGGISTDPFSSLNLGLGTGDRDENVLHNYRIVSSALSVDLMSLVAARQVHGNKIARIDKECKQMTGNALEPVLSGFDALITSEPGITLMVRVADCVPLIFFDHIKKVVAVVHAGWRGTLAAIGQQTIQELTAQYKSKPRDILVGIGPSIGPCCYRIQKEVANQFKRCLGTSAVDIRTKEGTLFLNLWETNRLQLIQQGIAPEHIEVAGLCTACRTDLFFSHRREQGKTGRFGAFAGLRR